VILNVKCELESQYPLVQATKSGAALKEVLNLSKHHLFVYMESLLTVCPYTNCLFDSRAKGVAEAVAAPVLTPETLINLKLANEPYMAY
jgi:hypothetical protein